MNERIQEIQQERPTATGDRYKQLNDELAHLVVRVASGEYKSARGDIFTTSSA